MCKKICVYKKIDLVDLWRINYKKLLTIQREIYILDSDLLWWIQIISIFGWKLVFKNFISLLFTIPNLSLIYISISEKQMLKTGFEYTITIWIYEGSKRIYNSYCALCSRKTGIKCGDFGCKKIICNSYNPPKI